MTMKVSTPGLIPRLQPPASQVVTDLAKKGVNTGVLITKMANKKRAKKPQPSVVNSSFVYKKFSRPISFTCMGPINSRTIWHEAITH